MPRDAPVFDDTDVTAENLFRYMDDFPNLYSFLEDFPKVSAAQALTSIR